VRKTKEEERCVHFKRKEMNLLSGTKVAVHPNKTPHAVSRETEFPGHRDAKSCYSLREKRSGPADDEAAGN